MRYNAAVALLVVDVQNDFADPGGALHVAGGELIIPFINEQIAAARAADSMVVYSQDWHPPSTPHFAKDGGIWPVHCVADTWGAALHPDLVVDGPIVRKGTAGEDGYSAFHIRDPASGAIAPTELATLLEEHGVKTVVVAGLATDYCVRATALDAVASGFETIVLAAGIRPVDLEPGDGDRALSEMAAAGISIT
ncbi:MAG: isochorismatase family protein [Acidimicrobiia bacterium]